MTVDRATPRTAVILVGAGGPPELDLGGIPITTRSAIVLGRSGVERCHVVGPAHAAEGIAPDPRVRCTITAGLPPAATALVACDGRSVFEGRTIERLILAGPEHRVAVARAPGGAAILAVFPATVAARLHGATSPLCAADGNLDTVLAAVASVSRLEDVFLDGALAERVESPAAAAAVEREIVAAIGNVRDGHLDRWLNRRLSRPISRLLVRVPCTPNRISLVGIILGVVGAALVAVGGYLTRLAGLLVIQGASVLDCCDGEVARLTFRESAFGEWLDIVGDTVAHGALFLAIGIAASRDGGSDALQLAALLVTGVLVAFACVTYVERTAARRARNGGWANDAVDTLALALSTRDYHAIVFGFALADRLEWFLWGAALGAHVFWVTLLVLLIIAPKKPKSA